MNNLKTGTIPFFKFRNKKNQEFKTSHRKDFKD